MKTRSIEDTGRGEDVWVRGGVENKVTLGRGKIATLHPPGGKPGDGSARLLFVTGSAAGVGARRAMAFCAQGRGAE